MSEFEDNLWLSVVREHGDELARTGRLVHKHRRAPRPQLLAGTTVGLAAVGDRGGVAARRVDQLAGVRGDPQPRRHGHGQPDEAVGDRRRQQKARGDGRAGADPGLAKQPADVCLPGRHRADDHVRPGQHPQAPAAGDHRLANRAPAMPRLSTPTPATAKLAPRVVATRAPAPYPVATTTTWFGCIPVAARFGRIRVARAITWFGCLARDSEVMPACVQPGPPPRTPAVRGNTRYTAKGSAGHRLK